MKTNRYPGVKPFETGEQDRFFGRDRDIADLYDLILLEKLVVLFGKSGYGKSSLLNAGIIPRLDEEQDPALRYHTLVVRIGPYVAGQSTLSPVENIQQRLQDRFPLAEGGAEELGTILPEASLWKTFKQRQMAGGPRRYLLIFDQFEEFFFYPSEERQRFKEQITELLYQAIPQRVREQSSVLPREQRQQIATPLEVKAIFAIREDRLSLLDTLKDYLPAILHKRYELRALSREQAQQAIVQPAALEGANYAAAAFRYDPPALEAMLDELSRSQGVQQQQIEAFLLQILCQYLEAKVIDQQVPQNLIRVSDLPQMSKLVDEYYQQRLHRLPEGMRDSAQRLVEALIIYDPESGESRRQALDGDLLLQQYHKQGATPELLRELENTFLLRREANHFGGFNYEISHDTLLGPIQRDKKRRLEAEQQRRFQRNALLVVLALGVAVAAILFSLWALRQKQAAEAAKAEAESAKKEATLLLRNLLREKIQRQERDIQEWQRKQKVFEKGQRPDLVKMTADSIRAIDAAKQQNLLELQKQSQ